MTRVFLQALLTDFVSANNQFFNLSGQYLGQSQYLIYILLVEEGVFHSAMLFILKNQTSSINCDRHKKAIKAYKAVISASTILYVFLNILFGIYMGCEILESKFYRNNISSVGTTNKYVAERFL